ncbi:MAG: FeoA family protein [Tissierellia bacterium]|nr:FeoA family protein [Tissierellia bacterium]
MPITLANIGEKVIIDRIMGNDQIKKHLNNLGFVVGKLVSVFSFDGTNYIISINDSRYAIHKDLARRIFVKEQR